jgi:3-dehydroquinate dehydratase II
MKILVIHGPNLNMLGKRDKTIYGEKTLQEIDAILKKEARALGVDVLTFQSNHEGALIDFIQEEADSAQGIIINPGALTHYGLSLLDALVDSRLPVIEVHISDIYHREKWRAKSVIAPIAEKQVIGTGRRGYITALQALVSKLSAKPSR